MNEYRLTRDFYMRDTVVVAKELLGKMLVRKIGRTVVSGMITETEAYRQNDDPASHAHKGITERNKAMFGEVGCAYVYFTYGMHYCMNVVARDNKCKAGAVLIRSLEPYSGINIMIKNRKMHKLETLTNGPGKITKALDITKKQYGEDLVTSNTLYITDGVDTKRKVVAGTRIGIKKATDKFWNFRIIR
jgi:DNA-3-methyladenine glycosylase